MRPSLPTAALAAAAFAATLGTSLPAAASLLIYTATLNGANEAPANASPGSGFATVTLDDVLRSMRVETSFSGLQGNVSAAHIHCCTAVAGVGTAGVATVTPTFTGFPGGVTAGSYDHLFDMNASSGSWNNAFLTANGGATATAFAALLAGLDDGKAYLNIHTNVFPGGEIRGFLQLTQVVPEPATALLVLAALGGLWGASRRRAD